MQLHILGICGTFMGGLAVLAREQGYGVSGSDQNVYPPMSTQLNALGIALEPGYLPEHLRPELDLAVIGNALSRGNPLIEAVLNQRVAYVSGPQWLAEHVLAKRDVLAVAGTHGKTTTTSILAWILQSAGLEPGFLVGGVPQNFGVSARLGTGAAFVIEADEYDTAFFDKRSKFVHYRPNIAILNNLEFDHADIFPDIEAIERQFHHLVRTIPGQGWLIVNADDSHITRVLQMGCYSQLSQFSLKDASHDWFIKPLSLDGSHFEVFYKQQSQGDVSWGLLGQHNLANALAALAAAHAYGVDPKVAMAALASFQPPKRRLEHLANVAGVDIFDDFAHHPTAIKTTLAALRARYPDRTLHAVLEPRSNTMRLGVMSHALGDSLGDADQVWMLAKPELRWDAARALGALAQRAHVFPSSPELLAALASAVQADAVVLFMSNGGFDGIQAQFVAQSRAATKSEC
jgi:UDP-N-acetylmuramate: L-alanyl-gamma-D-glutamyl-meso-diaminopimelate ligase